MDCLRLIVRRRIPQLDPSPFSVVEWGMSKFSSVFDQILYEMSLEGSNEFLELADGASLSLLVLVPPQKEFTDWTPVRWAQLSEKERDLARIVRAALVLERSDGIVETEHFVNPRVAIDKFREIMAGA